MTVDDSFPALFGDTVPNGSPPGRIMDGASPGKKRKNKSEKERYLEAAARARSLKERLEARRAQNRELFVEELYLRFDIAHTEGDFDDSERIETLRTRINEATPRRA